MFTYFLIAAICTLGISFILGGAVMIALSPPIPDTPKRKVIVRTVGLANLVAGMSLIYYSPLMFV